MATIKLKTKKSKGFLIEASGGGNIDTAPGTIITWEAKLGSQDDPAEYIVSFRDLHSQDAVWPFKELADGTGQAPSGYLGPLVLPYGSGKASVNLTTTPDVPLVKYSVTAGGTNKDKFDDLDPMIIIRPQFAALNVALGVTCAVLGAVAGALLTTWLL